jgi:hypothetical protein
MTARRDDDATWNALLNYARAQRAVAPPPLDSTSTALAVERAIARAGLPGASAHTARPAGGARAGRARRRALWALAALVPCAALATQLGGRGTPAPLPAYSLEVLVHEQAQRAAEGATSGPRPALAPANVQPLALSLGSELRVALRPEAPHGAALEVIVAARDEHGRSVTWRPNVRRGPGGALLVRAVVGSELPLSPGRWQLTWQIRGRHGAAAAAPAPLSLIVREEAL